MTISSKQQNVISFTECSSSYKNLKCNEQINSLNDTFCRWEPMDLMRPHHFSSPRNVLSRRQYCKASERDIVHPTYFQPPARTCIASSWDFWRSCFHCFQSTLAHPNYDHSVWLNGAKLVRSLALPFSKNLQRPFVLVNRRFRNRIDNTRLFLVKSFGNPKPWTWLVHLAQKTEFF